MGPQKKCKVGNRPGPFSSPPLNIAGINKTKKGVFIHLMLFMVQILLYVISNKGLLQSSDL